MKIRPGDRVRVTGARGAVVALVQEVRTPAELPHVPGPAPSAQRCRRILEEMDVDHVAMLSFASGDGRTLVFAAMRAHGQWFDVTGQRLEITPAEPGEPVTTAYPPPTVM